MINRRSLMKLGAFVFVVPRVQVPSVTAGSNISDFTGYLVLENGQEVKMILKTIETGDGHVEFIFQDYTPRKEVKSVGSKLFDSKGRLILQHHWPPTYTLPVDLIKLQVTML